MSTLQQMLAIGKFSGDNRGDVGTGGAASPRCIHGTALCAVLLCLGWPLARPALCNPCCACRKAVPYQSQIKHCLRSTGTSPVCRSLDSSVGDRRIMSGVLSRRLDTHALSMLHAGIITGLDPSLGTIRCGDMATS